MEINSFAERLTQLRVDNGLKREDIAKYLGCSSAAVANYENGHREPDFNALIMLAKKFNVSTDYLLGLTDTKSIDAEIKSICDYTGLSEESIKRLNSIKAQTEKNSDYSETAKSTIDALNSLLCCKKTIECLGYIIEYSKLVNNALLIYGQLAEKEKNNQKYAELEQKFISIVQLLGSVEMKIKQSFFEVALCYAYQAADNSEFSDKKQALFEKLAELLTHRRKFGTGYFDFTFINFLEGENNGNDN